jgi:hypothetical protein
VYPEKKHLSAKWEPIVFLSDNKLPPIEEDYFTEDTLNKTFDRELDDFSPSSKSETPNRSLFSPSTSKFASSTKINHRSEPINLL